MRTRTGDKGLGNWLRKMAQEKGAGQGFRKSKSEGQKKILANAGELDNRPSQEIPLCGTKLLQSA
ncbi:MAG TPA: hypothetical protein PKA06_11090 [Gemmatales bacterium]|nr:hypothetical protein [Gemmatales bacterium]